MNINSLSDFKIPDVWEVKDAINKMKSVVLNYTEMEAKVHEATNNDPWGASSTLMQELAQGTYSYQHFNEIMPTVYRRFTEKESKQWRQIYKALVLLEYLIKNGSERVVDDARSHVSMIKVMRNFYYIDDKGKDEGLNVRNRAKEIVELLSSTDKIRTERKLAKKNRNKYIGVGSDSGPSSRSLGFASTATGGSKYVGFGSASLGGGSGGGLSFNGDAMSYGEAGYPKQSGKYDQDDDGLYHSEDESSKNKNDLFGSEDEDDFGSSSKKATNDDDWGDFACGGPVEETKPTVSKDDDFADFQFAVASKSDTPASNKSHDLFDLLGDDTSPSQQFGGFTSQPIIPSASQQQQQQQQQQKQQQNQQQKPIEEKAKSIEPIAPTGMWAQASNFVSLDSLGKKSSGSGPTAGPSMNSLKSSSVQSDWNNWASNNQQAPPPPKAPSKTSAFDDLLF
ncbi:hypothetical protein INT47_013107 [Mucor saturninus]|uniref:ENTH domain-containing protein n=1 Tax=Mucor saturninus TaxID=64648 RepID=A0A8H7UXN8_9FUNG|nr:hypothetical protein INT47_013107 [Mucor saturninus]